MKVFRVFIIAILLLSGCNTSAAVSSVQVSSSETSSSDAATDAAEASTPTAAPEAESIKESHPTREPSKPTHESSESQTESSSFDPTDGAYDATQWFEDMRKERGISDPSAYNAAIVDMSIQIESSVDDTLYGGTGQIREVFTDTMSNETISKTIGIKVFYIDINLVKPIVTEIASKYSSVGRIDLEYIECKYPLSELKEFAKEIQSQDFFEEYVTELVVFEGAVYARVKAGSNHLASFLRDKPYRDAVVINLESTEPLPAVAGVRE